MEKGEIRPPLSQKPLNWSSPKFAWVITSETPTPVQNFMTIRYPPPFKAGVDFHLQMAAIFNFLEIDMTS